MAATDKARADRVDRIVLSERDAVRVLDLLENPPEPTSARLVAARRWAGSTDERGE